MLMKLYKYQRSVQTLRFASAATKSRGGIGCLTAVPMDERAPLMHWMADFNRVKLSEHVNHAMVQL